MKRRRHRKKNWDRHFYIQACTYIQTCLTQKCHFTQILYRTNTFAHKPFRAHRLLHSNLPTPQDRNFTSVFDTRTSFRAKGWPLRGASSALPAALREKRKRRRETVTEGKRQREREDAKMRRCEDEKMRRCADVKMWRCKDVKMRRCEDDWRCEDEKRRRCDEDVNIWSWIADLHFQKNPSLRRSRAWRGSML